MIINNRNKMNIKSKQGQALLVTVMLLATAITIVLSLSFRSTTETQVTKLQEENQKALAAAQAGIDAVLKSGTNGSTIAIGNLPNMTDISGNATVSTVTGNTFTTPLLQTDDQYTFYLAKQDWSNPWSGTLAINYGSQSTCDAIVLELTVLAGNPAQITRYKADVGNKLNSSSNEIGNNSSGDANYKCSASVSVPANAKLLLVRTLFSPTKLKFSGSGLPDQGKTVTSTAKSNTGVTKTIQLFQSYPQIPADFFVTSL